MYIIHHKSINNIVIERNGRRERERADHAQIYILHHYMMKDSDSSGGSNVTDKDLAAIAGWMEYNSSSNAKVISKCLVASYCSHPEMVSNWWNIDYCSKLTISGTQSRGSPIKSKIILCRNQNKSRTEKLEIENTFGTLFCSIQYSFSILKLMCPLKEAHKRTHTQHTYSYYVSFRNNNVKSYIHKYTQTQWYLVVPAYFTLVRIRWK